MTNDLPSRSSLQARIAESEVTILNLRQRIKTPNCGEMEYVSDLEDSLNQEIRNLRNLRRMFVDVSGL